MQPENLPRRTTRRDLLRLALGASAVLLVEACGPSPSGQAPAPTGAPKPTAAPAAAPTTAPAPTKPAAAPAAQPTTAPTAPAAQPTAKPAAQAQRGGLLRVGLDVDADTLDPRLVR